MSAPGQLSVRMMMRRYGVTMLLCVVLTGMVAVVGFETDWATRLRLPANPPPDASPQPAQVTLLPMFAMAPLDPTFKEIVERPLFVPTRRPSPAANMAPVAAMRKGQYRLTGTSVSSSLSMAFLVEKASGNPLRAVKGGEVGVGSGIKVDSVGAVRVVLRQGDETEELTLSTALSPKVAAAPPANAVAPGGTNAISASSGQSTLPSLPVPNSSAPAAGQAQAATPISSAAGVAPSIQSPPANPNAPVTRQRRFQNPAPTQ